jgi:hypothetical protein
MFLNRSRAAVIGLAVLASGLLGAGPAVESLPSAGKPAGAGAPLSFVPERAFLLGIARPRQAVMSKGAKVTPEQLDEKFELKKFGVRTDELEFVALVVALGDDKPKDEKKKDDVDAGLWLRFARPYDQGAVLPMIPRDSPTEKVGDRTYWHPKDEMLPCVAFLDDRSIMLGTREMLRDMLRPATQPSTLAKLAGGSGAGPDLALFLTMNPLRPKIREQLEKNELPPPMSMFVPLVELVEAIEASTPFWGPGRFELTFATADAASAAKVEQIVQQALELAKFFFLNMVDQNIPNKVPERRQIEANTQNFANDILAKLQPVRENERVSLRFDFETGVAPYILQATAKNGNVQVKVQPNIQIAPPAAPPAK